MTIDLRVDADGAWCHRSDPLPEHGHWLTLLLVTEIQALLAYGLRQDYLVVQDELPYVRGSDKSLGTTGSHGRDLQEDPQVRPSSRRPPDLGLSDKHKELAGRRAADPVPGRPQRGAEEQPRITSPA